MKYNICEKNYNINYSITTYMKKHLQNIHKIDENTAQEHRNWISCCNHVTLNLVNNTMTCKYCNQVFQNNNYFNIMIHLTDTHQIDVPFNQTNEVRNDNKLNYYFTSFKSVIYKFCINK